MRNAREHRYFATFVFLRVYKKKKKKKKLKIKECHIPKCNLEKENKKQKDEMHLLCNVTTCLMLKVLFEQI